MSKKDVKQTLKTSENRLDEMESVTADVVCEKGMPTDGR